MSATTGRRFISLTPRLVRVGVSKVAKHSALGGRVPFFQHKTRLFWYNAPMNQSRYRSNFVVPRGGASTENPIKQKKYRVFLAVGSNLGDRFQNIAVALDLLCDSSFDKSSYLDSRLVRTSFLYSTAPMYVTDQPQFMNGAVEVETDLEPRALLRRLKKVEEYLGRDLVHGQRNGPRPVDLDILFFDENHSEDATSGAPTRHSHRTPVIVNEPDLIIPHPLMQERSFVMDPLKEVAGDEYIHPKLEESVGDIWRKLKASASDGNDTVQILPLQRDRAVTFHETIVMGILNVTPDSFSDGGKWNNSVDTAVEHALQMETEGARIIDIGGESTRPGALEISIEEQIERTVPVIKVIRQKSDIPISIDTRHADVARAAIEAGADIVNDVSGGTFDPKMLETVAELRVPMILMHMRGTPESMQSMTKYENDDVCGAVTGALIERSCAAESNGIHRWQQVLDPGIGFAKDNEGNLRLLKHTATSMRQQLQGIPLLLGTSRKGFIGRITGESEASERDFGSVASVICALCLGSPTPSNLGCTILRVHNVKGTKQATLVMDAISKVD
ncbi:unnamed protein product [Cylindrotheca closterium]|uniref:Pterin-binding domain-containing protein n=1 Tax=Cylindrotheca closterium TaxID=2856 RepID=A0AAD2CRZ1_9STRA|nr:unnamed protein product [Cylindrotheca closterium]